MKKSEKPLSSQFYHNKESFNRITQHKKVIILNYFLNIEIKLNHIY